MITCASCKQPLSANDHLCPRCGADNQLWRELQRASGVQQMRHFSSEVSWIQIIAVILLLGSLGMVVVALLSVQDSLYWLAGAILLPLIGSMLAYAVFALRWRIREYEWLRTVRQRWRPSALQIAVASFGLALLLSLLIPILALALEEDPPPPPATPTVPLATPISIETPTVVSVITPSPSPFPTPGDLPTTGSAGNPGVLSSEASERGRPWLPILLVLILTLAVFSISIVADLAYVGRINHLLPRPLGADRARLARVIRREAEIILDSGRKDRNWTAQMARTRYFPRQGGFVTISEQWSQRYHRSVPDEDIAAGLWERESSQESVTTRRVAGGEIHDENQGAVGPLDDWQVTEERAGIEVLVRQMWRVPDGGVVARLAVLTGESEKEMKEGDNLIHLRLQEAQHYDLLTDAWGWPLELREADDYRLVQILRKDIPIIESPVPLALPKVGD